MHLILHPCSQMPLNSPDMHLYHQSAHSTDLYQALFGSVLLITQGLAAEILASDSWKEATVLLDFQQAFQKSAGQTILSQNETAQFLQFLAWGLHSDPAETSLWHTHTPGILSTKHTRMPLIYPFPNTWSYYYTLSKIQRNFKDVTSHPPFVIFI